MGTLCISTKSNDMFFFYRSLRCNTWFEGCRFDPPTPPFHICTFSDSIPLPSCALSLPQMSWYLQWSAFSKLSTVKYLFFFFFFKCMLFTDTSLCAFPSFARKGDCHYVHWEDLCLHQSMNCPRASSLNPLFVPKSFSNLHKVLQFLFQQYTTTQVKETCHAMQKYLSLQLHP